MKTVLVSGGTRGLGLAISQWLAHEGYRVVATGRSKTEALEDLSKTKTLAGEAHFARLDLSDVESIQDFVRSITKQHGEIFGLVNNAAMGVDGILASMHETEIAELVNVNLIGTIVLTKHVCRSMLIQRAGRIVNISSIIAQTGFTGLSVYAATKSGLLGFTKSLARELGKANITVNSVSPGFLETEMTHSIDEKKLDSIRRRSPLGRLVKVEEVAKTVGYLISGAAAGVTGTDIVVDAGSTA